MTRTARSRLAIGVALAAGVVALCGFGVLFALTVDETHFDRPDPAFDEVSGRVASVPGVSDVQKERWVEAPLFTRPSASMNVVVAKESFDEVWAIACTAAYPDAISWGFEVLAAGETRVSLYGDADEGCPAVGFEPAPVIAEIERLSPGQTVQAAIWDDGRFSVSSIDDADEPAGLLSLVAGADALREAAGVGADTAVEVGGPSLGVVVGPGEASRYHDLLSRLIDTYGATGLFLSGGGTPIDGVEKVQISAPAQHHVAIERAIGDSGLPIANLPVRFLS